MSLETFWSSAWLRPIKIVGDVLLAPLANSKCPRILRCNIYVENFKLIHQPLHTITIAQYKRTHNKKVEKIVLVTHINVPMSGGGASNPLARMLF